MNANIMKTHIFLKMKCDLKGHFKVLKSASFAIYLTYNFLQTFQECQNLKGHSRSYKKTYMKNLYNPFVYYRF